MFLGIIILYTVFNGRTNVIGNFEFSGLLILLAIGIFIFVVNRYFNRNKWTVFAIAFPMLLFLKLAEELIGKGLSAFDNSIYIFISKFITEDMTDLMTLFTFMGSATALILISAIILAILWKREKSLFYGWMIAINLTISFLLDEAFKLLFQRARPDILRLVQISGYSFPSGHSMTSISFYGLIVYLCLKYLKQPVKYFIAGTLALLVPAIGISRIYLGVHYASDVIAGFSAGMAWLAVFIVLVDKFHHAGKKPVKM